MVDLGRPSAGRADGGRSRYGVAADGAVGRQVSARQAQDHGIPIRVEKDNGLVVVISFHGIGQNELTRVGEDRTVRGSVHHDVKLHHVGLGSLTKGDAEAMSPAVIGIRTVSEGARARIKIEESLPSRHVLVDDQPAQLAGERMRSVQVEHIGDRVVLILHLGKVDGLRGGTGNYGAPGRLGCGLPAIVVEDQGASPEGLHGAVTRATHHDHSVPESEGGMVLVTGSGRLAVQGGNEFPG